MVQVSDGSVDKSFEWCKAHALEDPRPDETAVVFACRAAPGTAHNDDDRAEQIDVSFPPNPRTRHEQETSHAHAKQVVSCCECHVGEVAVEVEREADGVGGEYGRQRRSDYREEG